MVRFWLVCGVVTGTTAVSFETAVAYDLKIQRSSGLERYAIRIRCMSQCTDSENNLQAEQKTGNSLSPTTSKCTKKYSRKLPPKLLPHLFFLVTKSYLYFQFLLRNIHKTNLNRTAMTPMVAVDFPEAPPPATMLVVFPWVGWPSPRFFQVVLAALLLGFAAFTTALRGIFLIASKVGSFVCFAASLGWLGYPTPEN